MFVAVSWGAVVNAPPSAVREVPPAVLTTPQGDSEAGKEEVPLEQKDEPSEATRQAKADDRQEQVQRDALFLLLLQVLRSPK